MVDILLNIKKQKEIKINNPLLIFVNSFRVKCAFFYGLENFCYHLQFFGTVNMLINNE